MKIGRLASGVRRVAALVALTAMVGLFVWPSVACFKVFGWEQFEPIICSGTDEFGYQLPDIQDKIKAAVSDLLDL